MLRKIIAYQRLLQSSFTSMDSLSKKSIIIPIIIMFFINAFIFSGSTSYTDYDFSMLLPVLSVWMVNKILNNGNKLFEIVPVSRKYIVLNVFLLSIALVFIALIILWIINLLLIGSIFGILFLIAPQGFNQSPPAEQVSQVIDTTRGNILLLLILITILFAGTGIAFIKNKNMRRYSFIGGTVIGYGLLAILKFFMSISPASNKVDFFQSFSVMPQANTILICTAAAVVIICIASVFIAYRLYVIEPNNMVKGRETV